MPTLRLRAKHDRRARRGHPWVFANEAERDQLRALSTGEVVDVLDAKGHFVGRGLAEPHEQVAVRLLGGKHDELDDVGFWVRRLRDALDHRALVYGDRRDLRVVDGEGDRVGGLVIDRFGPVAVVQLRTAGLLARQELVAEAVREVLGVSGAVVHRGAEPPEVWFGDVPEAVTIEEGGVPLVVGPQEGLRRLHRTVHGDSRQVLAPLWRGKSVLEAYAGSGAWALAALHHGASRAAVIDKAEAACERAAMGAEAGGHELMIVCDEAKKTLELLANKAHRYDVVVLDPPPFAKAKKLVTSGLKGYRELLTAGLTLVHPGGMLVCATRSVHVSDEAYLEQLCGAAKKVGRRLRQVHAGGQAADHPVRPEMPESRRLRTWAFSVTTDAG